MKVCDYIATFLSTRGVTDTFGIPGGVILDLLYAFDRCDGIETYLCYHEQSAGFAAIGYAQSSGRLGVAYATRGPGFTNLLTPIADAYYDSVPVLFVTGHTTDYLPVKSRIIEDQEMDTCTMVSNITKFAKRVDTLEEIVPALNEAYKQATSGRKGSVLLDIKSSLFNKEVDIEPSVSDCYDVSAYSEYVKCVAEAISGSKRPVILVGDGINQSGVVSEFNRFVNKLDIPVLSSRYSHNVVRNTDKYYGYVGSHGLRYANFILSKADTIIVLGNRLCFPSASLSYKPIVENKRIIHFDIDEYEMQKHLQVKEHYQVDLKSFIPALAKSEYDYGCHKEWIEVCDRLRKELWNVDCNEVVNGIEKILSVIPSDSVLVSDVGNNEFWVSRACVSSKCSNRTLYSKSFGALGNAIGKAIGAYYSIGKLVVAFVGDQGFQLNIQELQYISQHQLPITIVLIDNSSSGMIKDREKATNKPYFLHTTKESGYGNPDFERLLNGYQIKYLRYDDLVDFKKAVSDIKPKLIHLTIPENVPLTPSLPKGQPMQDMAPEINRVKYNKLNTL